jgi:transposase-like protein
MLIGGPGVEVEVDESVLCRRGIIRNPTSREDEISDTVWILGIVEKYDKSKFYVTRIPNRTVETITRVLENKIGVGSILVSDGYPSYPGLARNLGLTHRVVNHSIGFVNENGDHTNGIENVWSQMKSVMNIQHGVKREDIDMWLEEFMFRKRNTFFGKWISEVHFI